MILSFCLCTCSTCILILLCVDYVDLSVKRCGAYSGLNVSGAALVKGNTESLKRSSITLSTLSLFTLGLLPKICEKL